MRKHCWGVNKDIFEVCKRLCHTENGLVVIQIIHFFVTYWAPVWHLAIILKYPVHLILYIVYFGAES
jgi:hypothetical protein